MKPRPCPQRVWACFFSAALCKTANATVQAIKVPDVLPAAPEGPRPVPSFAGVSILPVRRSLYCSTMSQLSALSASCGPVSAGHQHIQVLRSPLVPGSPHACKGVKHRTALTPLVPVRAPARACAVLGSGSLSWSSQALAHDADAALGQSSASHCTYPWGLLTRAWTCRYGLSWLWRAAMQSLAARQASLYRLCHKAGLHQVCFRALRLCSAALGTSQDVQ